MINSVKRFLAVISNIFLYAYVAAPSYAAGQSINLCPTQDQGATANSQFSPLCRLTTANFSNMVGIALQLLFIVAVIIALFFLVWGGIKWILSGGDKSAVEGARNTIVASLIGLAITFLAYFLLTFVIRIFIPTFDINNLVLPSL